MHVGGGQQVLTYLVLGGGGAGDEGREEELMTCVMIMGAFRPNLQANRQTFMCIFQSYTTAGVAP